MLRDLIKEKHDEAENHPFTKYLLSGKITEKIYAQYLYNQLFIYDALEKRAAHLFAGMESLKRYDRIYADLKELDATNNLIMISTVAYIEYIQNQELTDDQLMAHIYVRHMGDLFGGQMIKKVVPGSGTMYDFENRSELIQTLRTKLNDDMAEEANLVFGYAIELFYDLAYHNDIQ
jgi:heme oxygenase